ncbi:ABC transporter ATP-binding protein [bacterium]|nr:ABC transporter ATP-binding protein [bacterium]
MNELKIQNLVKTIEADLVLQNINLRLQRSEILCLLGPSGCGKTTLLRLICGLETPDSGRILVDGRDITGVDPHRRNFGMMFQEFALFPHKNVYENVVFGLRVTNREKQAIRKRAEEVLSLVGLADMGQRNVNELSGGERQRVALARSLAPQPRLLLLDEPMGSLDRVLRERLLRDLQLILKQIRITTIFVTHDHNEAFAVADRIAVFNAGRIEQIDGPENLYKKPANRFVASFLGFQNLIEGLVQADGAIQTALGSIPLPGAASDAGKAVTVLIRPEAARVLEPAESCAAGEVAVTVHITDIRFQGVEFRLTVRTETGACLVINLPNDVRLPQPDQPIRLGLRLSAMSLLEA